MAPEQHNRTQQRLDARRNDLADVHDDRRDDWIEHREDTGDEDLARRRAEEENASAHAHDRGSGMTHGL